MLKATRREFMQWSAIGLAAPGALLEACGGNAPAGSPAATATRPTGTLSVYSALNESTNNAFIEAFKRAVPNVDVQVLPLAAAGELQTRIKAERASPKADVFIGGSSEFHDPLAKDNLLVAYRSPNAKDIDSRFVDPNGYWTGWYLGIFGFVSNTSRISEVSAGKPQSWDDLLHPSWKKKLILPDPIKTGGGYIFLATQVFRFNRDEDKAFDYVKKLNANIAQLVGTAPQGIQLVAQGNFVGCPNWAHDILTAKAKGQPIELTVPKQTANEVGAISIVRNGPNTAAARAFVDWVLTRDGGELNVKLSSRLSVRKDVSPAEGTPTIDKVDLVQYDREWATANKDRLLKRWQQVIG